MSSYKKYQNVKRVQVSNPATDEFVSLVEYIIFESEDNDKYAIFKFRNNLEQYLFEVKFIVTQSDENDNVVEKSTISYKDFRIDGMEILVPDAKFKCNERCAKISCEFVYGAFEKIIFDNGNIISVNYDYQNYHDEVMGSNKDVQSEPKKKKDKNADTFNAPTYQKSKKKKRRKDDGIGAFDITKQNKTNTMLGVNILFSAIILGLCILFAINFRFNSERVRENDVLYTAVYDSAGNKYLKVTRYEGNGQAVIESEVAGLQVIAIGAKAFNKSKATSVVIRGDLEIEGGAFNGCKNLVSVSTEGEAKLIIHALAFSNCTKLESIDCPYSEIQINAISSSIKTLTYLSFQKTNGASTLARLFNGYTANSDIPSKLHVKLNGTFSSSFTDGFTGVIEP